MDDYRRRAALRMCDYWRRGIFGAEEAIRKILFFCVEPSLVAEYMGLLPDDLRSAMIEYLPSLPATDQEWAEYEGGLAQLDGNEHTWADMIAECRAGTDAAREHLLGIKPERPPADFKDLVRAARRERIEAFIRRVEASRETG
jgi:hypothetical protein